MIFIDPKTDFAFKKIFGSEHSHSILISFLNGILYNGEPVVESIEILNPYQAPRIRGVKQSYLDVKATINGNKTVIIEMQVLNVAGLEKRVLYNAAKAYSIQLALGERYTDLNPVIALTITDFRMFSEFDSVMSRFILKEASTLVDYPVADLELVFVELPKFTQTLENLNNLGDKWLYFMKNTGKLSLVPEQMAVIPEIQEAFSVANSATLTPEELHELEQEIFFTHDMIALETARAVKQKQMDEKQKQMDEKQKQMDEQAQELDEQAQEVNERTQELDERTQELDERTRELDERMKKAEETTVMSVEQESRSKQVEIARQLLPLLDDRQIGMATGLTLDEIARLRRE